MAGFRAELGRLAGSDLVSQFMNRVAAEVERQSGMQGVPPLLVEQDAAAPRLSLLVDSALLDGTGGSGGGSPAGTFLGACVYHSVSKFYTPTAGFARVVLTFDSERYDTQGFHSTSVNNTRLTIPEDGKYHVGCNVQILPFSDAEWFRAPKLILRLNGALDICYDEMHQNLDTSSPDLWSCCIGRDYLFTASDYIEATLLICNTAGLQFAVYGPDSVVNYTPEFWIHRIETGGEVIGIGPAGPTGPTGPAGADGADGADGVGVTDGNKGSVTVSGGGTIWTTNGMSGTIGN